MAVAAAATLALEPRFCLLTGIALVFGAVDSAHMPAAGALPPQLLAGEELPNLAPTTSTNNDLFTRLYVCQISGSSGSTRRPCEMSRPGSTNFVSGASAAPRAKDAGRSEPRCCAAGKCCRQVGSEQTVHHAWTVPRSSLSAAIRDELVTRNVAGLFESRPANEEARHLDRPPGAAVP